MDTAGKMLSADEKTFTVQLKPASKLEMDDDQCNNPDIVTNVRLRFTTIPLPFFLNPDLLCIQKLKLT
uniref:MSP domain-containing protein n=1 Tax=Angiostrongylus cantonensis TaxID=6313 RepID=A0A0K0CYR9_ANGCA